jgi:PAS domain-containing protein
MDTQSTLFDLLPIGAYRSSIDGRQLRANAALVQLNGYASEKDLLAAVNDIGMEWYVQAQRRA